MNYYTFITLSVLCVWTRAKLTDGDIEEIQLLRNVCHIECPYKEQRVCTIDLMTFRFKVFINKCFQWGLNKCKRRLFCVRTHGKSDIENTWLIQEAVKLRDQCHLLCPMKEERVCAIDLLRHKFKVFFNKCFLWGLNTCKGKQYFALKTIEWCARSKVFEWRQRLSETKLM